jgi:hypothetical protein
MISAIRSARDRVTAILGSSKENGRGNHTPEHLRGKAKRQARVRSK